MLQRFHKYVLFVKEYYFKYILCKTMTLRPKREVMHWHICLKHKHLNNIPIIIWILIETKTTIVNKYGVINTRKEAPRPLECQKQLTQTPEAEIQWWPFCTSYTSIWLPLEDIALNGFEIRFWMNPDVHFYTDMIGAGPQFRKVQELVPASYDGAI